MTRPAKPERKLGCMLLAFGLLILWALGGWALYRAALNSPAPDKDEASAPFEFIPSQEGN
ncbi:MAG: hypothetical protein HDQ91_05570 [Desulfovibrio sp.]|nr:hypothetical protein [Desulfovibrio sp.]